MQTKFFVLVCFAAVVAVNAHLPVSTNATGALVNLNTVRNWIYDVQRSFWSQISEIRTGVNQQLYSYYSEVLTIVKPRVEAIPPLDTTIRASIASLSNQSAECTLDSTTQVNKAMTQAGVRVSNCIIDVQDQIANSSADALPDAALFSAIDGKINNLPKILVDVLIGRNIYTQYNEIESLAEQRYNARSDEIRSDLSSYVGRSNQLPASWESLINRVQTCLTSVHNGVVNSLVFIEDNYVQPCHEFQR